MELVEAQQAVGKDDRVSRYLATVAEGGVCVFNDGAEGFDTGVAGLFMKAVIIAEVSSALTA